MSLSEDPTSPVTIQNINDESQNLNLAKNQLRSSSTQMKTLNCTKKRQKPHGQKGKGKIEF